MHWIITSFNFAMSINVIRNCDSCSVMIVTGGKVYMLDQAKTIASLSDDVETVGVNWADENRIASSMICNTVLILCT